MTLYIHIHTISLLVLMSVQHTGSGTTQLGTEKISAVKICKSHEGDDLCALQFSLSYSDLMHLRKVHAGNLHRVREVGKQGFMASQIV